MADLLAPLLGQSFNTMRERLRDTYREADAKAGNFTRVLNILGFQAFRDYCAQNAACCA